MICTLFLRSRRKWVCAAPIRRPWDRPGLRDRGGRYMYGRCSRKRHTVSAALGKGAGIKVMDGSLMCHGAVVERLKELAAGAWDPGPSRISCPLEGRMQVPCIFPMTECWREGSRSRAGGIHSPVEMADLGDVDACIRLAAAFASSRLE